jgi:hypothetical protein
MTGIKYVEQLINFYILFSKGRLFLWNISLWPYHPPWSCNTILMVWMMRFCSCLICSSFLMRFPHAGSQEITMWCAQCRRRPTSPASQSTCAATPVASSSTQPLVSHWFLLSLSLSNERYVNYLVSFYRIRIETIDVYQLYCSVLAIEPSATVVLAIELMI